MRAAARRAAGRCRCGPMHEIVDRHLPLAAVRRPDRADAVERRGQRDHRPGRQRHAEVAADRRHVPDLERGQKRACSTARSAARRSRRAAAPKASSCAMVQVAAIASPPSPACSGGQPRRQIDQPREVRLRLGEQPGAAGEPGVALAPRRQFAARCGARHRLDGVQVHGTPVAVLWSRTCKPGYDRRRKVRGECNERTNLDQGPAGDPG